MWRLLLASLVLFSLAQPALCQNSMSRNFHIERSPYTVDLAREQPLVVDLQGLGEGSVVAVEPVDDAASKATFNAWYIDLKNTTVRERKTGEAVLGYEPLPSDSYWSAGSAVRLNATPKVDQRVVVHLAVPAGEDLVLRLDGRTVFEAKVTSGSVIERGEIHSNPLGYNVAAILLRASTSIEPTSAQMSH